MSKKKFKTSTVIITTFSPTLLLSLVFYINTWMFINNATLVKGNIVEVNEKMLLKIKYSYSIQYLDENNKKLIYKTAYVFNEKLKPNDEIELYYNRDNKARINNIQSLYQEVIAVFSIGASFFLITIILLV